MELKDFQGVLQQFIDDGLARFDVRFYTSFRCLSLQFLLYYQKTERMVSRVMEEELQAVKLRHIEEVGACLEASPVDLLAPDKPRKANSPSPVCSAFIM